MALTSPPEEWDAQTKQLQCRGVANVSFWVELATFDRRLSQLVLCENSSRIH